MGYLDENFHIIIRLMAATIIDGANIARQVREQVTQTVAGFTARGKKIHLAAMIVGSTPAGELYAQRQGEACRAVGIGYQLHTLAADVNQQMVKDQIHRLNDDEGVTGIMLHMPLPSHMNATELQYEIAPRKDVEGVNPANIGYVVYGQTVIAPCTARAAVELINSTGVEVCGAEAVVVGASEIAGKPIALLLMEQMATVTVCHVATRDLALHTRRAEILVVAVGKPDLIGPDHVKEGAVVIDVGINRIKLADGTKKTVGDVSFEAVRQKAGFITPVPGGVGPMTVAMLLKNTMRCAELVYGTQK